MQYAKVKYSKTYKEIISNSGLKKLFVFLHNENNRLTLKYGQNRSEIFKQFSNQLKIEDNFIFNTSNHIGKGLYDYEVKAMTSLFQKPEHKILQELKK